MYVGRYYGEATADGESHRGQRRRWPVAEHPESTRTRKRPNGDEAARTFWNSLPREKMKINFITAAATAADCYMAEEEVKEISPVPGYALVPER